MHFIRIIDLVWWKVHAGSRCFWEGWDGSLIWRVAKAFVLKLYLSSKRLLFLLLLLNRFYVYLWWLERLMKLHALRAPITLSVLFPPWASHAPALPPRKTQGEFEFEAGGDSEGAESLRFGKKVGRDSREIQVVELTRFTCWIVHELEGEQQLTRSLCHVELFPNYALYMRVI